MNKIKEVAINTKNHLKRNTVSYALGALAISAIALQQKNAKSFYTFLESEGIDVMKYLNDEQYEEL